jgi:hypothetical protein
VVLDEVVSDVHGGLSVVKLGDGRPSRMAHAGC